MLGNRIKLRFPRRGKRSRMRKQFSREKLSENEANVAERTKAASVVREEEYFTDKSLSIMTDTRLEADVIEVDDARPRRQGHADTADGKSNSFSSADSRDSYIVIAAEEMPVKLRETNWEYVDHGDITESVLSGCIVKKYCSPRCSSAWFLKIRRGILKNCSKKIYPLTVNG